MKIKNSKTGYLKKTALVSALLLEITSGAQAATIQVDGTTCSFADAVVAANTDSATGGCTAGAGADILELTSPTVNLFDTALIESDITINGNGNTLQSDGNNFLMLSVSEYNQLTPGDLTINNTIVQNGYRSSNIGSGARVYLGSLNINQSTFTNNSGGAVLFSPGTSGSIVQSEISGNNGASGYYYSGGVSVSGASVTIDDSTISNNSTITASSGGGGLYIGNYGGALNLTITNSTISGNTSDSRGGGISHKDYGNGSTVTLNNVTIVDNSSSAAGGGLSNDAANITLNQTLISGNSGTGGSEIDSTGGTVTVDNYNLFGLNSNAGVAGVTVGASDIVPTVATLAEIIDVNLADNGGPTSTHNLNASGPAVDVIPPASCLLANDQTGNVRPIDGDMDGHFDCDVGALEFNSDIIFKNGFE